jgi:hypothetical protein
MITLDRRRLKGLMAREQERFRRQHPRSRALREEEKRSLLSGVPMNWMTRWRGRGLQRQTGRG